MIEDGELPIAGQKSFMNERYYRRKNFNKNSNKTEQFFGKSF